MAPFGTKEIGNSTFFYGRSALGGGGPVPRTKELCMFNSKAPGP